MDDKTKRALALWRLGVLGPLVSARLEHGDRQQLFQEIAARTHQMPDGKVVELSPRTIESWYYAHKRGGFEALYPSTRSDCGQSRAIAPDIAELILRAKREKPRRSIKRIIRMLERARKVKPGELARSSVHRLLQLAGVSARPVRGPSAERRSFIAEHAGDLWVGDALHGPRRSRRTAVQELPALADRQRHALHRAQLNRGQLGVRSFVGPGSARLV